MERRGRYRREEDRRLIELCDRAEELAEGIVKLCELHDLLREREKELDRIVEERIDALKRELAGEEDVSPVTH